MTPTENLHYAISQLAYAVAYADGKTQNEERIKFHNLVASELRAKDYNFDISDIIFMIMDQGQKSIKNCYNCAITQIRLNSNYLSPRLKNDFIRVIGHVANAYPAITAEEREILEKFNTEISVIQGDPVYYEAKSRVNVKMQN
jgi:uncharacterized tellurite resistance protein B-like protein